MPGSLLLSLVYQNSPWIHKQFYRGQVVFLGTVYTRDGAQASRLTDTMDKGKEVFILFFSKHRFFMLDKCILKLEINPGFHGTLYSIDKL